MIALVLAGTLTGLLAAMVALGLGQPWWVALALYTGLGVAVTGGLAGVVALRGARVRARRPVGWRRRATAHPT